MLLQRVAPLLLVLVACADADEDGTCREQGETYHVVARVSMHEPDKSAGEAGVAQQPETQVPAGKLLVTVSQDHDITFCGDGLAAVSTPARDLMTNQAVARIDDGFSVDVHASFYPDIYVPSGYWLDVLLDENGNGGCDEGEPRGGSALGRSAEAQLSIELKRGPCPGFRI